MTRSRNTTRRFTLFLLGGTLAVGLFSAVTAFAGPVTGGPNNPPYVETGVYQGVVSIVPGGPGDSVMEIGNLGTDIASTGDIYLRPQNSAGPNAGVRLAKNAATGKTDLHVYGRLCLAGSCLDTWPVVGGTSFWVQNSTWLEPATANRGLYTATNGGSNYNLEIYGDHPDAVLYISKQGAGGTALTLDGYADIMGNLDVGGNISVLDCPPGGYCSTWPDDYSVGTVWYPGNDGRGSGLDGSKLDGVDFHVFRDPYGPSGNECGGFSGQWCICGEFNYYGGYQCLNL